MSGMSDKTAGTIGKALERDRAAGKRLPSVPPRGTIPSAKGEAKATASAKAGGGGIDSPLTEQSREYYPTTTAVTTDGLLQVAYQPIKSVTFKDASKREVVLNYANPAG